MPITNCTKCGELYEDNEEAANEPGRLCLACYQKKQDEKEPYCRECGGDDLAYLAEYANGAEYKCRVCGTEQMW